MTVIYSNFGDVDTKHLTAIWEGIENLKVVEVTRDNRIKGREINRAIAEEKDTILFCGHGSPEGCWNPNWSPEYTLCKENLKHLKAKNVIGIWCHASSFAKDNNLKGFYSSMYISNYNEAVFNRITEVPMEEITKSEDKFCRLLNGFLKEGVPLKEWKNKIMATLDESNAVEVFNFNGLYFN